MSARTGLLKALDSALGPAFCAALSRAQREPESRTLRDFPGGRVLVVRPGGIGDAALLLPMLRALRAAAPGSALDVLCESRNAPVFELSGLADRVLRADAAPFAALHALRRGCYAAVLDTEQFHRFSAVLAAWTRAPLRVGFNVAPDRLGLYTHAVPYDLQGPEDAQFGRILAAALGVPSVDLPPREGSIPPERLPLPPDGLPARFVALHPGGSVPCKRWGEERYAALAAALRERAGLPCVLVGAGADRPAAARIARETGAVDLCGRLDLAGTAAVLARAETLVGPDSGVAHLAVAAGTRAVVLFGPGDPLKWGPPSGRGVALREPLPCSPCSMFGYTKPCRANACMAALSVERVLEAALSPAPR
jgi:ADP-heptose:LPS heptosyltransferase